MNKANMLPQVTEQRIERKIFEEAVAVVKETRTFIEIVRQMNEGMTDMRLDTGRGTLEIIHELKTYNSLMGETTIPIICGDKDKQGNLLVFFEV